MMQPQKLPQKNRLWSTLAIVLLVLCGCVGSGVILGASVLLYREGLLGGAPAPTPTWTPAAPPLATPTPGRTRSPTATPSRPPSTPTPTRTQVPTRPPPSTPTRTRVPTRTPTPTSPGGPTPLGTPTPIVCSDPSDLSTMRIAPGQRFDCAFSEAYLDAQIDSVPENPCQEAYITLDDGQFTLVCRIGLRLSATGVAQVQDCRVSLQITQGTPGFKSIVQELISAQMALVPYDTVCVTEVTIDDGEMTIQGYGR